MLLKGSNGKSNQFEYHKIKRNETNIPHITWIIHWLAINTWCFVHTQLNLFSVSFFNFFHFFIFLLFSFLNIFIFSEWFNKILVIYIFILLFLCKNVFCLFLLMFKRTWLFWCTYFTFYVIVCNIISYM